MRAPCAALALLLLGACSIEPFDPRIGEPPMDAATADGQVTTPDSGRRDSQVPPGNEDCTNGTDDDGDGDVDCADSDCGAYVCVDEPPSGWGPYGVLGAAGCPGELAAGSLGLRADDVTCGGCSCGGPTGETCMLAVRGRETELCGGLFTTANPSSTTPCDAFPSAASAIASVSTYPSASCAVTGPTTPAVESRPPHAFESELAVCDALAGGGCGAGQVCIGLELTAEPLCVTREGDVACPPELPWRRVVVTEVDDMRSCTDCRCNSAGGTCAGTLRLFSAAGCAGTATALSLTTSTCTDVPTSLSARFTNVTVSGVSCNPAGGNPDGCVAASARSTICCDASAGPTCPAGPGPNMVFVEHDGGRFCIDSTEVTNEQYQAFLDTNPDPASQTGRCLIDNSDFEPRDWPDPPSEGAYPVTNLEWCDAAAYCAWAGKRLCRNLDGTVGMRDRNDEEDPMIAEWTYACSAGGALSPDCDDSVDQDVASRPCCEVDGVYDAAGGAGEWVASCDNMRCLVHRRNGCNDVDERDIREEDDRVGFRCCADPIAPPAP